jgi:hypothetical protein
MEPRPLRSPSYSPLLLNGVLLLVMGVWAAVTMRSEQAASDSNVGAFILVTLGLPLLNGGLALRAFISHRRVAALLFVLCTLLWGGWAIFFVTDTVLSFHKIGG